MGKPNQLVVVCNEVIKLGWYSGEVWCNTLGAAEGLSERR